MNTMLSKYATLLRHSPERKYGTARLAMVFIAVGSVWAAPAQSYDGVTLLPVSIIELSPDGNRFGLQLTNGTPTSPPLCSGDSSGWAVVHVGILGATQDGYKAMLATAMAAQLSGLRLRVYAYNPQAGESNCIIGALDLLQ